MGLRRDAYIYWFHIGSYRLAGHFFTAEWVGSCQGMGCLRPKEALTPRQRMTSTATVIHFLSRFR